MNSIVSRLIQKIRTKYRAFCYRKLKNRIVIIHTLGKVGSSTVYRELKKISPWNNIFHTHFLSDEWLNVRLKDGNHFDSNQKAAKKVFSYLEHYPNNKKFIISLVREPVSREVSNFMQNPKDFLDSDILSYSIDDLQKEYLKNLSYDYTLDWFDSEFLNYTGFDVYSRPFDKENGYSIYQHGDFMVLIIKLEKLNDCFSESMKEFLGLDLNLSRNSNQSSQKNISGVYYELKNSLRFTEFELNETYSHKYVTHFYTEDEIMFFKNKWSKKNN